MAAVVAVVVAAIAAVADGCSGWFTSTPIGYIRGLPRFSSPVWWLLALLLSLRLVLLVLLVVGHAFV